MRSLLVFIFLFFSLSCFCQNDEFTTYSNGLIYSEETIANLKNISDSLNLEFLECGINHEYNGMKQVIGNYVNLKSGDIISAKKDLESGISYSAFIQKYPFAEVQENILIVQFQYKKDEKEFVDFDEIAVGQNWNRSIGEIPLNEVLSDYSKKWIFRYNEKNKYSESSLYAFYFPNAFASQPIPKKYAHMIGYSNCMIDTTSSKISEDAEYGYIDLPEDWLSLSIQDKNNLLNEFRNTKVIGTCSMDTAPRVHAKNIAILSSEVANWSVFLKAHLDIMNDRFERMSDGSYGLTSRNTYLKEIEELDINTLELLFGITFRIDKPSLHHYFGSPRRIGRAMSEISDNQRTELVMVSMIEDSDLDLFNRILVYFTFRNYINNLTDKSQQETALRRLKLAIGHFPNYIKERIVF